MNDFEAIDQLLAAAAEPAPLPPAEQRRALRAALGLSRAEVARALGVSPFTVAGWESGRDPRGETREKYAYFLKGADAKISTRDTTAPDTTASEPTRTTKSRWTGQPSHRAGAGPVSGRGRS
ncbi:helix-turn-helix domain protein [Actinobacteria bacterium OK006]|nr:helix-turn-helix domain protein [Actinobacteria bacterium OK006]